VLARYPIKELETTKQKEELLKSLEKGNVQAVTFTKEGKEERMFIEANPQFKTLNLYDSRMLKQFQGVKKEKQEGEKSQDKKEIKQEADDDNSKKSRRRGMRV
jgi:hypothetical protein